MGDKNKRPDDFLEPLLASFFRVKMHHALQGHFGLEDEGKDTLSAIKYAKRQRSYYGKLRRLCKKHGITWTREHSYWDFSKPIGTIGLNENVDDYESAYKYVNKVLRVNK